MRAIVCVAGVELPDLSLSHGPVGSVLGFDHAPYDERVRPRWHELLYPYPLRAYKHRCGGECGAPFFWRCTGRWLCFEIRIFVKWHRCFPCVSHPHLSACISQRSFIFFETATSPCQTAYGCARPAIIRLHFSADGRRVYGNDYALVAWDCARRSYLGRLPAQSDFALEHLWGIVPWGGG